MADPREAALRQFRQWLEAQRKKYEERAAHDGWPLSTRAAFYEKADAYTWAEKEFDRLGLGETREEQP